jgi:hypothetical protein
MITFQIGLYRTVVFTQQSMSIAMVDLIISLSLVDLIVTAYGGGEM